MAEFIQPIGVWGVALTLGAFALGTWLNKKTGQAICNPLLLGSIFVIVFLSLVQIPFGAYKEPARRNQTTQQRGPRTAENRHFFFF